MSAVAVNLRPARLAATLAALLTGGCTAVGPDFQRPDVPWLENWPVSPELAEALAPPAAEVPHDTWWLVFDDPALDAVVAEAQRSNPSVRVAGSRIMEARAQLGIAGSALYPQDRKSVV